MHARMFHTLQYGIRKLIPEGRFIIIIYRHLWELACKFCNVINTKIVIFTIVTGGGGGDCLSLGQLLMTSRIALTTLTHKTLSYSSVRIYILNS